MSCCLFHLTWCRPSYTARFFAVHALDAIFNLYLLQILNQFPGGLQPDLVDMQRYAAWKAADIRKAIREGRQPTAGPPVDDQPLSGFPSGLYLTA